MPHCLAEDVLLSICPTEDTIMACTFAMASTPSPWSSLDISMPPSLTLDICLPILLRMSLYLLAPMGTSLCLPTLLRTSLLPFATQRTLLPLLLYGEPCSPLPPQRTSLSPLALWRTLLLPLVPWRTLLFPLASWKMLFSHLALPWTSLFPLASWKMLFSHLVLPWTLPPHWLCDDHRSDPVLCLGCHTTLWLRGGDAIWRMLCLLLATLRVLLPVSPVSLRAHIS